ncbi:MAG: sigma-70 family RNA polymerase sigma factor [Gammaproteobacteria bacterium]
MTRNDEAHWSELMQRSQAGNAPAYEQLLTELADGIMAYLRHRFGPADFTEDCVQECLFAIHQARHTFMPGRPFRPWLFAIVRNRAIDMLRRQHAYTRVFPVRLDDVQDADLTSTGAEEQHDRAQRAGSVLELLAPGHREALRLTKLMGYSIDEAAGHLGISRSAMKVRVHRATRAAVRVLEGERE